MGEILPNWNVCLFFQIRFKIFYTLDSLAVHFFIVHNSERLGRLIKRTQNYDFIIYFRLRIYFKTKNGLKFEKFAFCLILERTFMSLSLTHFLPCRQNRSPKCPTLWYEPYDTVGSQIYPRNLNPQTEGFCLRIFWKVQFWNFKFPSH